MGWKKFSTDKAAGETKLFCIRLSSKYSLVNCGLPLSLTLCMKDLSAMLLGRISILL